MISTTLITCIAVASAAIVIALMMWKPRSRRSSMAGTENAHWRDATLASMLVSIAATLGLARAAGEQSDNGHSDGGYNWHGSHVDHSPHGHSDGGTFSDGGGGGDAGGGGI
jgi:hypothetical protein